MRRVKRVLLSALGLFRLCRSEMALHCAEASDRRVVRPVDPECDVETILRDLEAGVGQHQMHRQRRILRGEFGQQGCNPGRPSSIASRARSRRPGALSVPHRLTWRRPGCRRDRQILRAMNASASRAATACTFVWRFRRKSVVLPAYGHQNDCLHRLYSRR
jgi:hypothetical protein